MKAKQVIKIGTDICMTVLLFVLMAFHYVGLQWHEVTGAAMPVLFILHHILNGKLHFGFPQNLSKFIAIHAWHHNVGYD